MSHFQVMLNNIETKEVVQWIKRTLGKMKVQVYISIIIIPQNNTNKKMNNDNDTKNVHMTAHISNSTTSYMEIQSRYSIHSPVNLRGLACTGACTVHLLLFLLIDCILNFLGFHFFPPAKISL